MALIKCKECNREISKSAKTCPSCGAKNKQTGFFTKLVLGLIVFTVAVNIFRANTTDQENKIKSEAAAQEKANEEKKLLTF